MSAKTKYQLEIPIQASPSLLYQYISTPSGLSEWFADNVNSRGKMFTFIWEGSEEEAELVTKKNGERIKLRWLEEDDDTFFELRIQVDGITKDVSLIITDFADDDETVNEGKLLWENMIDELKQILGSS